MLVLNSRNFIPQFKVDGLVAYEVEPDLAGEKVTLWWGLFDNELYMNLSH